MDESEFRASVAKFQAERSLRSDGDPGPKTWAAVQKALFYPTRPPFAPMTHVERLAAFGDPLGSRSFEGDTFDADPAWKRENIVALDTSPWRSDANLPPKIWLHKRAREPFEALLNGWKRAGLLDRVLTWNGSLAYRVTRGGSGRLSAHAFGAAFDICAEWNGFRKRPADHGEKGSVVELVPIAIACGFFWGGHFKSATDGMHFELAVV